MEETIIKETIETETRMNTKSSITEKKEMSIVPRATYKFGLL